jgi:hypothetical protein
MSLVDLDAAIFNPASVFKNPEEVLQDAKIILTQKQKIRALQTWQYDIQLRRVAEEENMRSSQDAVDVDLEDNIIRALNTLKSPSL